MLEFIENLRDLILQIRSSPASLPLTAIEVPPDLDLAARKYLIRQLDSSSIVETTEEARQILEHQLVWGELNRELRRMYRGLINLGVDDRARVDRMFRYFIDREILRKKPEFENPVNEAIFTLVSREHGRFYTSVSWTYYLREYARYNNLLVWNGNAWKVLPLGNLFLKLSSLQDARFLLTLERYLSSGGADEWHIPADFLTELLTADGGDGRIEEHKAREKYPAFYEYLERLETMGLVNIERRRRSIPEHSTVIRCTDVGRQILQIVLGDEANPIASILGVMIDQELTYSAGDLSEFEDLQELREFCQMIDGSPIVAGQRAKILAGIDEFRRKNYVGGHLSLLSSIEGILRSITSIEKVQGLGKRATLQNFVDRLRAEGVISPETARFIGSLDRNGILHANLNPSPEMARPFCTVIMNVIRYIHSDYESYRMHEATQ